MKIAVDELLLICVVVYRILKPLGVPNRYRLSKHTGGTTTHDGETTIQCRSKVGQHIAESIGQWRSILDNRRLLCYRINENCLAVHFTRDRPVQ